jgi:SAM-dependent methyltransferase
VHSTTERVQAQYERYPYPPVEQTLGFPIMAALDYVRASLWPRRPNLEGLRVLDAGCGTGHAAVEIACRHPEVEIVAIDLSASSLEGARRRADQAKVAGRIAFHQGAIEDLAALPLGDRPFDYILSSGVLHHLVDPVAGVRALAERLAPEGILALMVYAPHGRHGVYVLQELLRRIGSGKSVEEQVALAREILGSLPDNHPFRGKEFADQKWFGDAGIVDLLLHAQDRSFTVPELRELVGSANLQIARFFSPYLYRPASYVAQASQTASAVAESGSDPAAIAELLSGNMRMHVALVSHAAFRPAVVDPGSPDALAGRPLRSPLLRWSDRRVLEHRRTKGKGEILKVAFSETNYTNSERQFTLEGEAALFFDRSDGTRTAEELFADPALNAALLGQNEQEKRARFFALMSLLIEQDLVFLLEP